MYDVSLRNNKLSFHKTSILFLLGNKTLPLLTNMEYIKVGDLCTS